ncbi:hypothetical protein HXX76_009511 [Chlamydomonas incerta]|uniref:Protein kinase domain-containing protein n=1 Tax=Chlamydomonas incerta TaxID=51695 RepID=A0A835SQK0_CHLIN|nr:hypothetical protein HXX76_009511 [Chlamydomonas incerta]|eukprot:KAG2431497.1 hypothetical protein HXX76_009511 [Chlamydomonas incerta]
MDDAVDKVQVESPLIALTEAAFQGIRVPILLNRTVTIAGSPMLPERPSLFLFAKHKVELQPGVTMSFLNLVVQYTVSDMPARVPNLYLFSPSKAPGGLGPGATRITLLECALVVATCMLQVDLRIQVANVLARPASEGAGPQQILFSPPDPAQPCANDSAAPLMDRCWFPRRDFYQDMAMPGAEATPVTDECLATYGPYGCIQYTYQQLRNLPPVPMSAQMTALMAQDQEEQQQTLTPPGASGGNLPAGPAPAGSGQGASGAAADTAGGGGSDSQTSVIVGAVVGGVVGAALLVLLALVAALALHRRRRKGQQRAGKPSNSEDAKLEGNPEDPSLSSSSSADGVDEAFQRQKEMTDVEHGQRGSGSDGQPRGGQESGREQIARLMQTSGLLPSVKQGSPAGPAADGLDSGAASPLGDSDGPSRQQAHSELAAAESSGGGGSGSDRGSGSGDRPRPFADLVVKAAPLRAGLATTCVVLVSQEEDITACISAARNSPHPCAGGAGLEPAGAAGGGHGQDATAAVAAGDCAPAVVAGGGRAAALMPSPAAKTTGAFASRMAAMLLESSASIERLLGNGSSRLRGLLASERAGSAAPSIFFTAEQAMLEAATIEGSGAAASTAPAGTHNSTHAAAVSLLPNRPAACEEEQLQPAQVVEVVELLPHKLGKGSYGRVVEGRYRGRRVAVKQALDLHAGSSARSESVVASFLQEVEVMGRCQHPNICTLLAACLAPPKLCLVMEMMDTNLEALVFGRRPGQLLPLPKLLHIAIQVAQGLEYLHPTVYHRDLKPANVLVSNPNSDTPTVKLTDFGLSKITEVTLQTANPEQGTPAFMAPECFDVENFSLTHQMDMYSFGVLLWTMLTGLEPWKDCSVVATAFHVHSGKRLPLDDLPGSRCPRKLRRLIEQCWEAEPRRRPAAAEVVKELALLWERELALG